MANLQYSSELLDEVLFRSGEPTDGTSDFEASALRLLNRAYKGIWSGGAELDPNVHETWWWLRSTAEGTITVLPRQTGTATVNNNSTTVTLAAAQTPTIQNYRIKFADIADVFLVPTHTAGGTAVVLDSVYTDATGSKTWEAFLTDYALPSDLLSLTGPLRIARDGVDEIKLLGESEFQRLYPMRNLDWGTPTAFCFVAERTIRFNKAGRQNDDEYVRVDFSYTDTPSDLTDSGTQEPVVPLQYRYILSDWATAMLFADKDDDRAAYFFQSARGGIAAMAKEHRRRLGRSGRDFGRIATRYNPVLRNELRTASGIVLE